jgi:hypothetical protein
MCGLHQAHHVVLDGTRDGDLPDHAPQLQQPLAGEDRTDLGVFTAGGPFQDRVQILPAGVGDPNLEEETIELRLR